MADGNVFELVRGVLGPVERLLDYLFYAGVWYGTRRLTRLVVSACSGVRTYFIPIGRGVIYLWESGRGRSLPRIRQMGSHHGRHFGNRTGVCT